MVVRNFKISGEIPVKKKIELQGLVAPTLRYPTGIFINYEQSP